jgi:two-component system KDP operon response regulator KdpE
VLVIDDETAIRQLLLDFLDSRGYDVEEASTTAAGLEAARLRPPSVVLIDLHLPGVVSSAAAVATLSRDVPVIVVTGTHDAKLAWDLLNQGAFDYITKPFDLNRLATLMDAAVALRRDRAP